MNSQTKTHGKGERRRLRIAMIGPASYPETGTSILLKVLLDRMPAYGVDVDRIPIPIGSANLVAKLRKFLGLLAKMIRVAPHVDVISVHVPTLQLANVACAALIVARIFRRIFVLRKFGGTDLDDLGRHARWLAEQVMKRSDITFAEAKGQCEDLRKRLSTEIFWYPNYRCTRRLQPGRHRVAARFIYLGRVQDEKGIGEIVEAAGSLGGRCSVDVYGPYENRFDQEAINRSPYVHYQGVLSNSEIPSALSEHGALLLPTYWNGEGYPGVIIEAFHMGVPVIATHWKFIPEIVDETCGILVEPGDARELASAMDRLVGDEELARRLQMGALSKAKTFSADRWIDLFVQACQIAHENSGDRTGTQRQIEALYAQSHQDVSEPAVSRSDGLPVACRNVCSEVP